MADILPQVGCFVYEAVAPNGVEVQGDENGKKLRFSSGQLFAVDQVEHSLFGTCGPKLRLVDGGTGRIAGEAVDGTVLCKNVDVQDGIWVFYVVGDFKTIRLLSHPVDRQDLLTQQTVWPLQKIFCDKRVKTPQGIPMYRVQGMNAWVPARRDGLVILYPEVLVSKGLKVYKLLQNLAVRAKPTINATETTGVELLSGSLVAVDTTLVVANSSGSGPFLHLADNSGWLFVNKQNEAVMEEVAVKDGTWEFQVADEVDGVIPKTHPVDTNAYYATTKDHFKCNDRVVCDKVVHAANNVKFYRVKGTQSWVPDRRVVSKNRISDLALKLEHIILSPVTLNSPTHVKDESFLNSSNDTCTTVESSFDCSVSDAKDRDDDDDEEEALREKLSQIEVAYFKERNELLSRIVEADLKRNLEAYGRVEEETRRLNELKALRREIDERNEKIVSAQMATLMKRQQEHEKRRKRGFLYSFEMKAQETIAFSQSDLIIAMGGKATVALNESNILRYSSGLPKRLLSVIDNHVGISPLATYISLGNDDRYFVRFSNGMTEWCVGNDPLEKILKEEAVNFIAFGSDVDSYALRTKHNIYWSEIPISLEKIILDDRPIHSISLGPNDEYFVAWEDGSWKGDNWIGSGLRKEIDQLERKGWHIRDIKFGDDSTYIIRYSDYAGPF